jgi:hypothetical protein
MVEGAPQAGDKYHLLVPVRFFYAESILSTTAFNNRFTEKRHDLGSCHFPLRCFTMTAQVPPISNLYSRDCAGGRDSGCQRMGLTPESSYLAGICHSTTAAQCACAQYLELLPSPTTLLPARITT